MTWATPAGPRALPRESVNLSKSPRGPGFHVAICHLAHEDFLGFPWWATWRFASWLACPRLVVHVAIRHVKITAHVVFTPLAHVSQQARSPRQPRGIGGSSPRVGPGGRAQGASPVQMSFLFSLTFSRPGWEGTWAPPGLAHLAHLGGTRAPRGLGHLAHLHDVASGCSGTSGRHHLNVDTVFYGF